MQRLLIHEPAPPRLYRYFKEQARAEAFLAGLVRLSDLNSYTEADDAGRHDCMEGRSDVTFAQEDALGWMTEDYDAGGYRPHGASLAASSPMYVCCLSTCSPDAEPRLCRVNSDFVVKLADPILPPLEATLMASVPAARLIMTENRLQRFSHLCDQTQH
jgi:hypothetical protein